MLAEAGVVHSFCLDAYVWGDLLIGFEMRSVERYILLCFFDFGETKRGIPKTDSHKGPFRTKLIPLKGPCFKEMLRDSREWNIR